jgi:hypothetical protein
MGRSLRIEGESRLEHAHNLALISLWVAISALLATKTGNGALSNVASNPPPRGGGALEDGLVATVIHEAIGIYKRGPEA